MQPAVRPPAPSRSLLRFLRSQAEHAFQRPRQAYGTVANCAPVCRQVRSSSGGSRHKSRSRAFNCGRPLTAMRFSPLNEFPTSRATTPASGSTTSKLGFCTTAISQKSADPQDPKVAREPTWQERLWGSSARKGAKPLKPDDLPSHDDFEHGSMFTNRRMMAAKAALEPRLRCTEVDENGKVILVDGEFKKTELIAKYGLLPRDLRKIDSSNLPHILIRPSAILLNLLHLKVLIKHDRVLLFDVYGSKTSYPQSAFMYDLQGKLQQKPSQDPTVFPTSSGPSKPS
ncbi:hypothetical protein ACCO45_010645 [Purpureocillium lilacinum]|uniref:Uncharacterized protein n=1 Tax=Purpureocillium lilacinum TaxID=33203 RepID=A0ACC4DGZ4_PURLI